MKQVFLLLLLGLGLFMLSKFGFSQKTNDSKTIKKQAMNPTGENEQVIYFAGGCFWVRSIFLSRSAG